MPRNEQPHNPDYEKRSQEMLFDLKQGIALINDLSNEELESALTQLGYSDPESRYALNALRTCKSVGIYRYMEQGNPHGVIMWEENSVFSEVPLLTSIEKLGDGVNGWIVDVMYDEEKYDITKFPHQIFSGEEEGIVARFFIVKFSDFDTDPGAIAKIINSMTDVVVIDDDTDLSLIEGAREKSGRGEVDGFIEVSSSMGGGEDGQDSEKNYYKPLFIQSLSDKGFVLIGMGNPQ